MTEYRRNRLIEIARNLSPQNRDRRSLHFSFILDKNKLLITSVNDYRQSHPERRFGKYVATKGNSTNYRPALHSEIAAIREFINRTGHSDFSGLTLFNVRIGNLGNVLMSRPCPNCQRVLDSLNFKRILWTND